MSRYRKIKIRDFLCKYYPDIDLNHKLVKDVLFYFDNGVLSLSVARRTYRIQPGEYITADNCVRALAAMYDLGLMNVKDYVDTAYEWKKSLEGRNKK